MDTVLFQALIVPHRSLSRRGLRLLAAFIAGVSTLIAIRVWLLGAWPAVAFGVVEVALALGLLGLNARHARASELVVLTAATLSVTRTDAGGRCHERRLPSAWLNVVLKEEPARVPRLLLACRDASEEIGAALGEAERRELAAALREAMWRMRNPLFDNPQLRDGNYPVDVI